MRSKQDMSGKPLHLLKSDQKDASAGLKLQRVKMQKNSKFKNLKVDTNLCDQASERAVYVDSALDTGMFKKSIPIMPNTAKE